MTVAPRRLLIVNADDYELSAGVSAGIRRSHLFGLTTSTTIMVSRPSVAEQMRIAQNECPDLALGVHLTMTIGQPLSGRSAPSLPGAES